MYKHHPKDKLVPMGNESLGHSKMNKDIHFGGAARINLVGPDKCKVVAVYIIIYFIQRM